MDIQEIVKSRQRLFASLFFSFITLVIVISLIIDHSEKTHLEKQKQLNEKKTFTKEQITILREILSNHELSKEEYDKKIEQIVDLAVKDAMLERYVRNISAEVLGNVFGDMHLAIDKWGIQDTERLASMRDCFLSIAMDEVETRSQRAMGLMGIKQSKKETEDLYNQRLDVFEENIKDPEKKELFRQKRKVLESITKR